MFFLRQAERHVCGFPLHLFFLFTKQKGDSGAFPVREAYKLGLQGAAFVLQTHNLQSALIARHCRVRFFRYKNKYNFSHNKQNTPLICNA